MLSSNKSRLVKKETIEVIRTNEDNKVKYRYEFKNKLIIFIYYLKLFLTLSHFIKLFYQTCLIYLII